MNATYRADQVEQLVERWRPRAALLERSFESGVSIYGAGFVGTWARRYLQSIGAVVRSFVDRDPRKIGSTIDGVPVIGPASPQMSSVPAVFIAARHAVREVTRDLEPLGCAVMPFDGYFVCRNYARLAALRDGWLADPRSVETFNAILVAMLTGSVAPCRAVMEKDMYFGLPEFSGNFDEAFVDAGAFVGDTVERFLWENLGTFRHIYAFEPGHRQFQALRRRMGRLAEEWAFDPSSVSLERAGLAAAEGRMACTFVDDSPLRHGLAATPAAAPEALGDERLSAPVRSLDQYLEGRPVTFIKADVEGMEMELLRGAQATIRRCRPKMALCIYHYPSDLYEVAEYVRGLVPEYKLSLRQHAPILGDYVLYCWTEDVSP
jgi:FkbM family methyltransferase